MRLRQLRASFGLRGPEKLIRITNSILGLIFFIALFLLAVAVRNSRRNPTFNSSQPSVSGSSPDTTLNRKQRDLGSLTSYLAKVQGKSLFKVYQAPAPKPVVATPPLQISQPPKVEEAPKPKLRDLANGLALNGIISGQHSQAIIINTATGKTYFLTQGETIGDILIKSVQRGKVVLGYGDEELDLRM